MRKLLLIFLVILASCTHKINSTESRLPATAAVDTSNAQTSPVQDTQAASNLKNNQITTNEQTDNYKEIQDEKQEITNSVQVIVPDEGDAKALDSIRVEQELQKISAPNHEVIRRIVVFPFHTEGDFKQEAEVAWWKTRELLSEQQRFLVATKRFMQQKEVFQPRKQLKITDVILLSKILDSDCLITGYISNKKLILEAYSGQDGQILWTQSILMNASKPLREQLEPTALKLTNNFLATLPYHGFQIVDPLSDKSYSEQGENIIVRVDVGAKSSAKKGEKAQWVQIERISANPLFQGGSQVKVLAEGEILSNENQVLTVSIKRAKDLTVLEKKSLVHIPEEQKRLASQHSIKDPVIGELTAAYLSEPMVETETRYKESRPLLTALASIANILLIVLLAF